MSCENCGISMQSPCGIICLSDCSVCWCTVVEAVSEFSAVAQVKLKPGVEAPRIEGSTKFQICTTDVSLANIAKLITHVHPTSQISVPKGAATPTPGMKSGTLDQLIAELGLAATPKGAPSGA